jgi:hypothetical protein
MGLRSIVPRGRESRSHSIPVVRYFRSPDVVQPSGLLTVNSDAPNVENPGSSSNRFAFWDREDTLPGRISNLQWAECRRRKWRKTKKPPDGSGGFEVPKRGLEPPLPCGNQNLNLARLPIPPLRLANVNPRKERPPVKPVHFFALGAAVNSWAVIVLTEPSCNKTEPPSVGVFFS